MRICPTNSLALLCCLVTCCLLGSILCRPHCLPYERGPVADVTWETGGNPFELRCRVIDSNGDPLSRVSIAAHNNSGDWVMITDESGWAVTRVGEYEIDRLEINEVVVLDRPHAYFTGIPRVDKGLSMTVVIKDRNRFARER
jgi:hypothetical protein